MKLQFDSSQDYQLQAVKSVINLFEGQPLAKGDFELSFAMEGASITLTEKGVGNNLVLKEEQLLKNLQSVQRENRLVWKEKENKETWIDENESAFHISAKLAQSTYQKEVEENGILVKKDFAFPNFTIEMETGTGKTYTFLRTIYELNKVYGFKKFVIVVPSVAIREGTLKNLQITHDHFQSLYGNPPINYIMYDRGNLTALRNFATSNAIQILVINVDSFAKDSNVINTVRETGVKPMEYIQYTQPIVIIDEPQNFETDVRQQAITNLNPLCTLRYSATHRNFYNLIYSLNPVQAYDLGLVKQIEVDGITSESNYNAAFIHYKGFTKEKKGFKAKIVIYVNESGGVKQKEFKVETGQDLYELSNHRDIYKGFVLTTISRNEGSEGYIEFNNGEIIKEGEIKGGLNDDIMQYQIEQTVKHHFRKINKFKSAGIKVLSLFFIDRVANYRDYEEGNIKQGKFALWFEEAYKKYQKRYPDALPYSAEQVHNGYFSSDKTGGKGKDKKEIWIDSKEKNTQKDEDTYSLIMKDKERLLSLEEPLQFIFSHSALREGWDNPNVFQICTLNESKSELKKRQEIGRGLRLPVDSEGLRIQDKNINILTVIANETYEEFSKALQNEIQTETSIEFKGRVMNARAKAKITFPKELNAENYPLFYEIWDKISQKTRYSVEYSTVELIKCVVEEIKNNMPKTQRPMLESKMAAITITNEKVEGTLQEEQKRYTNTIKYQIPDVYSYIQSKIDITRSSIYQILKESGKCKELEVNPQMFLDNVITCIKNVLNTLLIRDIKYEPITGERYEMTLFDLKELEPYLSNLFPQKADNVKPLSKTLLQAIPFDEDTKMFKDEDAFLCVPIDSDSSPEKEFAKHCESDENIKFFFKLPRGFKIPTPIGDYRPDWAVVFENDSRIYFVAETKSTLDKQLLRGIENMKISCGKKHFALFKDLGVQYKQATTLNDVVRDYI